MRAIALFVEFFLEKSRECVIPKTMTMLVCVLIMAWKLVCLSDF